MNVRILWDMCGILRKCKTKLVLYTMIRFCDAMLEIRKEIDNYLKI